MSKLNALIGLLLFFTSFSFAKSIAVLETVADSKDLVPVSDLQNMTKVFRERAVQELPAKLDYTVMTRENVKAKLPPEKMVEGCKGTCLAETGRSISADYVCQARIGGAAGALTLTAELYETVENRLLASFDGNGKNVNELLNVIKNKAPAFFGKVKEQKGNYADLNQLASDKGILVLKPVYDSLGAGYKLSVVIDGKKEDNTIVKLDPGVHELQLTHPCYDPIEYKTTIEKGQSYVVKKKMVRGIAGIDLRAEYNGEPQEVAVFVDGVNVGKTPYKGTVLLCSKITVQGEGWSEDVVADLKWHLMTRVNHVLQRNVFGGNKNISK